MRDGVCKVAKFAELPTAAELFTTHAVTPKIRGISWKMASSDPGLAFLEANGKKDGVITLKSGLQYKVLKEGGGMEHPKVDSPCECHYAGQLLSGEEFDSSYKRGTPTTFAPNQVIKGWTEAMQLMVQGDKWEMCKPPGSKLAVIWAHPCTPHPCASSLVGAFHSQTSRWNWPTVRTGNRPRSRPKRR